LLEFLITASDTDGHLNQSDSGTIIAHNHHLVEWLLISIGFCWYFTNFFRISQNSIEL
jgi:hypothetical protein